MTRITLMSAAAALAFTPAALAQYEDPDGAYMNESPTRQDQVQRSEEFYEDDGIDTSGTMGPQLTNTDEVRFQRTGDGERADDAEAHQRMHESDMHRVQDRRTLSGDHDETRNHPMTTRHHSRLEQVFHAMDANNNGTVSRDEWGHWQSDTGRAYRFADFNSDNDAALSWNEYRTSAGSMYPSTS